MTQELKDTLLTQEDIQVVYFDEKGNWAFHNREVFDIEKTRDELLGEPDSNKDESEYSKMTVALLKEEIELRGLELPKEFIKADLVKLLNEDDIKNNQNS
jgi:hypothetical protein